MDIESQFLEACQRGDIHTIKSFLDQGISPNCNKVVNNMILYPIWVISFWPLYQQIMYDSQSVEERYMKCVKLLIDYGADFDKVMVPSINYTIRDGLKNLHLTFLEKCEEYILNNDSLFVKNAQYE